MNRPDPHEGEWIGPEEVEHSLVLLRRLQDPRGSRNKWCLHAPPGPRNGVTESAAWRRISLDGEMPRPSSSRVSARPTCSRDHSSAPST
jgi:hypothetical protein